MFDAEGFDCLRAIRHITETDLEAMNVKRGISPSKLFFFPYKARNTYPFLSYSSRTSTGIVYPRGLNAILQFNSSPSPRHLIEPQRQRASRHATQHRLSSRHQQTHNTTQIQRARNVQHKHTTQQCFIVYFPPPTPSQTQPDVPGTNATAASANSLKRPLNAQG